MFGYVLAHRDSMTDEQLHRYRACYCGLCRSLRVRHGFLGEMTLTYDMAFLVMLLNSLYEPPEQQGQERCIVHPIHVHDYSTSFYTDYAADLNVALAYYNFLDDWQDERHLHAKAEAALLKKRMERISQEYPRQCRNIQQQLQQLREIEQSGASNPDAAANSFGLLMAELFVVQEDHWSKRLRNLGAALGRFIYIMDAVMDLEEDRRRGSYNPLLSMVDAGGSMEQLIQILTQLIGECTMEFEALPLVQDADILRNILYTGVWSKLHAALYQKEQKKRRDPVE